MELRDQSLHNGRSLIGVIVLKTDFKSAQERAEASFKKKAIQFAEGQKAWAEYEAKAVLVREKTARLRALRLAREAACDALVEKARAPKRCRQTMT
jgi:hypothetical protein